MENILKHVYFVNFRTVSSARGLPAVSNDVKRATRKRLQDIVVACVRYSEQLAI
jgi:hypothetical protein